MNLSEDVDLETFVNRPDKISIADISATGIQAVRKNRYVIIHKNFNN